MGHIRPRGVARGLAAALLPLSLVWVACGPSDPRPAVDPGPVPVPEAGAYFGTHVSASLTDREDRMARLEEALGRRFAIDHVYHRWDEPFPGSYDRWTVSRHRLLFLSWTPRLAGGGMVTFSDIVAGRYDDQISARARAVAELGVPVLMGFGHEPGSLLGEPPRRAGTAQEYTAAWEHIVHIFEAESAPVSWVWTLTAHAFREGDPEDLYPGDDIVDWVGVDGYVNVDCPWLQVGWASWADTFEEAASFSEDHAKPLVVAEFGLREDPADPDRKATWLRDSLADMQALPQLRAVVSFNSTQPCSAPIWSSPRALQAYAEIGADNFFDPDPRGS